MTATFGYNPTVLSRALRAPWWIQSALAVVTALVAFGLTLLLNLRDRPFLVPTVGVVLTALRGGFAPGLICGITTLALATYYLIPPTGTFHVSLQTGYELSVFTMTAAIISMLGARGRRAQLTLEATVASIGDGVIVTNRHGRVVFLNDVAEELTGWSAHDAKGQQLSSIFTVLDEKTRGTVSNPIERVLQQQVVLGLGNHTILVCRDGSERPIADSAAPILDEHKRLLGAVLVFRDATPQRLAEESLKRQGEERQHLLERERSARADAERANRLKDEFLATLSHELRTPLNAVLGWSHMLNRRHLTTEQQKQALAAIHRNAQAQARLVDDVLDLSRIVTGRMALAAEPVDLAELVRTTAESFTPAILGKRQRIHLDLEPRAEVTADPHRLRQIIWNLLSNANKFTPDEGTIAVAVATIDSRVELTVTDTGEGIDRSFLPFVFDRFRQADSSTTRGHGGLGLGLSLVRHLVEAHGGTVFASSDGRGRGTTMTVTLPARLKEHDEEPAAATADRRSDMSSAV